MSIIFAGAAPYEFINVPSLVTTGAGVTYDNAYTEGAIAKDNANSMAIARFFKTPAAQEIWVHMKLNFGSSLPPAGTSRYSPIQITDQYGGFLAGINVSFQTAQLTCNNSNVDIISYFPRGSLIDCDIHLFQSGSLRVVELYADGALIATCRATVQWTNPAQLFMAGNTGSTNYFSEIIVTEGNAPTVGMRLHTKRPNPSLPGLNTFESGYWGSLANGNLSEGVVTSEDGARLTGGFDTYTGPATPLGIRGLVQSGRYLKNGSLLGLKGQLRIDDINYDTPDFEYHSDNRLLSIWEKNPATDEKFQVSDFAGLQGGFYTVIES